MTPYEKRQQDKEQRERYYTIAQRQLLIPSEGCAIKVAHNANVHVMQDGGAFVEATIWVPEPFEVKIV